MKIPFALTTLGLGFAALASTAPAQVYIVSTSEKPADRGSETGRVEKQPKYITMSGTAEIKVVPDLVDLQFEVTVRDRSFEAARKDQAARSARVLAALRAAGVKEGDLNASQAKITTAYDDRADRDGTRVQYYQITQTLGCTLHEVSQVTEVTSAVVSAGATGVGEAQLRTSQLRKYRDEARHKAAAAAKEKAAALVGEIDQKLGRAFSIRESGSFSTPGQNVSTAMNSSSGDASTSASAGGESSFAPGMISVVAGVEVTYVVQE